MGNCNAVCGLDFLSSKDLTRSTLSISPIKLRSKVKSQTTILSDEQPQKKKHGLALNKKGRSTGELSDKSSYRRSKTNSPNGKDKYITIDNDFRIIKILKDGKHKKVCLVSSDIHQGMYAMKIIHKKKGMSHFFPSPPSFEKEILEKADHPFVPTLLYSSENERKSILVTEYLQGGSLGKMLGQLYRFSEEITKFYCAEVLLALEHLHEKLEVSYNNLSPQNVLLDSDGHIKLISFGSAEHLDQAKHPVPMSAFSMSTDGSPRSGCEPRSVTGRMRDFWGFGGFVYELLTGVKPFQGSLEWPQNVSKSARDLVTRLFDPTFEKRLGYNGIQEIKQHVFFSGINWEKVSQKAVYPPLKPTQTKEHEDEVTEEEDDVDSCSIGIGFFREGSKLEPIKETTSLDTLDDMNPAMTYTTSANRI